MGFREKKNKYSDCAQNEIHEKSELRVMIVTMGLSRIVNPIVNQSNVIGIIESTPRNNTSKKHRILYKALKLFSSLVKSKAKTLRSYAKLMDIPYYYMNNGSDKNLENWVKEQNPDVILVYSMSQLLKGNIFSIPKYGTINLHPSLLPKYRGPNPWFWSYYNKDSKGGVTVHYIDKGEDTGDIIYQESYNIPLGMKSPLMHDLAIGKIGVDLLLKSLENVNDLPRKAQPEESPTQRAGNIKEYEHKNIIDWQNWEIERIWHILRGTELWLNALEQPQGVYKGQRWIIENFQKCQMDSYQVSKVYNENGKYFVACKDGKIFLAVNFNIKNFILNLVR
ncbi:hypothetical protein MN086_00475 [Sulfurovum sp. XGS-02]|uniref:methionyl-tRNA formyltransferase n=1 Tax=Sulfurovum sp. XGS-02 TaxID=2925411 RepID=UPI002066CF66|nr:formyltransferase family protein [Sulfurovum sp. XGS-02]UPT77638.1 hypothetical protein MN086_00475 [Sulfurovum sp. XGS-02]